MNLWAALYTLLSIICVALTEFLYHISESANPASTVFSVISFITLGLALGHLLVFWSHIYESSKMLVTDDHLSLKSKLILASFYGTLILMFILGIIGIIVYNILETVNSSTSFLFLVYYDMFLYLVVITFILCFSVGFFLYGIRMYILLRKLSSDTSLFKMKMTRFLLLVVASFIHFGIWIIINAIHSTPWLIFGSFLTMYLLYFLHLSMLAVYVSIAFVLFNAKSLRLTFSLGLVADDVVETQ
jgi:hypothetical protein